MFSEDNYDYWQEKSMVETWHLVCSGALVSQHAVLVPAHCITEPGQSLPYNMADLKVVLGENKRLQHIKVKTQTQQFELISFRNIRILYTEVQNTAAILKI